ncbi:MAG: OmpL47-type beta-barrel domain-containing protein [Actinomycetota bacterium]
MTTSNDTICVVLTGANTATQVATTAKTDWTFNLTAAAGDGAKVVTATAFPKVDKNNVCEGKSGASSAGYTVDNTGATVSGVVTPTPNAAGWNNSDATITWTGSDTGVGHERNCATPNPDPCTHTITADTGAGGATRSSTATDRLGNAGPAGSVTVKLDKTPPTINASANVGPNANGWNNTDVTVSFLCSDGGSGIKTCSSAHTLSTNAEGQSSTRTAIDNAGNQSSATFSNINIDKVAPTLSGSPTTSPNHAGWYNSNVSIAWTCSDALSGIPSGTCPSNSTISGEGEGVYAVANVTDRAGNQTVSNSSTVKIDKTAPNTTAFGMTAWTKDDVTVSLTPTDNLSGVAATSYSVNGGPAQSGTSVSLTTEGVHSIDYWSQDAADNSETPKTIEIKIDRTAPTISPSYSAEALRGWFRANVTVSFTCSDPEPTPDPQTTTPNASGIASCTGPGEISAEGAAQSVPGSAVDNAGNSSSTAASVSLDKTPPSISAAVDREPNAAGWYKDDVTVSYLADDALSGIFSRPSSDVLDEGADQSASGTAEDMAGNETTAGVSGIDVDETPPTLMGAATTGPNGNGWYNGEVTIAWACEDLLSGLDGSCPNNSTITGEGSNLSASASVSDRAGNGTNTTVGGIKIDTHAPSTTLSLDEEPLAGWHQDPPTVTLKGVDSLSGVDETYYTVNSGTSQAYSGPFQVSDNGANTVTFWSIDEAGNVESSEALSNSVTIQVDTEKPTISGTPTPARPTSGWYNEAVSVAFTCEDRHSRVASCSGGETRSAEGADQSVTGTATDNAGNSASATVDNIDIDLTPPTTTVDLDEVPASGWYSGAVEITLTPQDALSGPDATYYTVDGGEAVEYDGPFIHSLGGTHTIAFWSSDVAGNLEVPGDEDSITIKIDDVKPTIAGSRTPEANLNGWNNSDVTVNFTCDDDETGLASCEASKVVSDEGADQAVTGTATDHAGNTATDTVDEISIDKTPPTLSGAPTTEPNTNGWYNHDVTIDWTCEEVLSGIDGSCPANSAIIGEGTRLTSSASVSDKAGNTTKSPSEAVDIDRTAPLTRATGTGAGWSKDPFEVVLVPTDGLSGVDNTYYTVNGGAIKTGTSVTLNEGVHTVEFWSVDRAGNTEAVRSVTVNVDETPPTIDYALDPEPNLAGWNNSDVTVTFTCDDALSKLAATDACTTPQSVTTEGEAQPVSGTARDAAGNETIAQATVSLDKTPPTVTAETGAAPDVIDPLGFNSWYRSDVTVTFSCKDALSGVATCPSPQLLEEGYGQTASGTGYDAAGNSTAASVPFINVDKTKPTISGAATTPANDNGWYRGDVVIDWTCDDKLSGIAEDACPSNSTIAGEGDALGDSASVFDVAGNQETGSVDGIKIDRQDPAATIDAGPEEGSVVTSTATSFDFSASDNLTSNEALTIQCKLDAGDWAACVATENLTGLSQGNHTFSVRATDLSGRSSTSSRSFTVDTVGPVTTVTSGPSGTTDNASPTFRFSADEPNSTFECRLDGAAWASCDTAKLTEGTTTTGSKSYSGLVAGAHILEVRATDAYSNLTSTAATRSFTVAIAGSASQELPAAGGTVSTSGGTAADPVAASVTTSNGGTVAIVENPTPTGTAPTGFAFFGNTISISAPAGSVESPLRLVFRLDSSILDGATASTTQVYRNGAAVLACTATTPSISPNPCVSNRETAADGDVIITVLTSHASDWSFAKPFVTHSAQFKAPIDGGSSVINIAKLGRVIPVKIDVLRSTGGKEVTGPVSLQTSKITCDSSDAGDAVEAYAAGSSNTGNQFRLDGEGWIYNLDTSKLTGVGPGLCYRGEVYRGGSADSTGRVTGGTKIGAFQIKLTK